MRPAELKDLKENEVNGVRLNKPKSLDLMLSEKAGIVCGGQVYCYDLETITNEHGEHKCYAAGYMGVLDHKITGNDRTLCNTFWNKDNSGSIDESDALLQMFNSVNKSYA